MEIHFDNRWMRAKDQKTLDIMYSQKKIEITWNS